ncbi:MAG: T9SS type B sorting domain-containing protein, partial [Ginsengibacter sp.]
TASICAGGSQLLTTSGGTSYQWSLNGSSIAGATSSTYNANTAGTYSVVITNGTCSGPASNTSTINISNSQAVEITALGSTEICEGKSVSIVANINGTYQWYKNGVPLANTDQKIYIANEAGKYMVIVKAAANCTSSSNEIDVTKIPPPKGSITSASDILCEGNSMILYVTGGSSYQWFENGFPVTGATTSSYSAEMPGVYSALIMNDKGCEAETLNTLILKMVQKPTADFTFDLSCQKQANHFTNTSTYENSGTIKWQWDFGDLSTADSFSVSHIFADSGKYFVTLTAVPVACPQLSSGIKKEVNIIAGIQGIKYFPVRVIKNVAYPLTARNIGQKYLWQPAAGLNDPFTRTPFVTASKEITYTIKINMENGCSTVDTLLVQVFDKTEVFVPRAFTPNANNANDVLRPIVVNIPRINFFKVFNRWGQLVFQTQKTGEGWDGKYKGSVQPTETYTWVFEGTDINGNIIKSNGQTILIR